MKLSLFVLLISLNAFAQTGRLDDIIDGVKADAARERGQPRVSARKQLSLQSTTDEQNRQSDLKRPAEIAVRAQSQVTTMTSTCPPYSVHDYSQVASLFKSPIFTGVEGEENPRVTAVDFKQSVPDAKFEMSPTVMIDSKSGWSVKEVTDALAKVSKMYAQCGIRIGAATIVSGTYKDVVRPMNMENQLALAGYMTKQAPKPWLFYIDHRADNELKDGSGTSDAMTNDSTTPNFTGSTRFAKGATYIAKDSLTTNGKRNGYTPEIIAAHELAHLLTDGDHQQGETRPDGSVDPKNILADDGKNITPKMTAVECAQMRSSPYVKPIK